jgi:hypothetical protein
MSCDSQKDNVGCSIACRVKSASPGGGGPDSRKHLGPWNRQRFYSFLRSCLYCLNVKSSEERVVYKS